MISLEKVDASLTLRDHSYLAIRNAISEIDLYDESTDLRIDERSMACQLGVSRTPVREALTRLENEGFVEIQARKGVFLKRLTLEEIVDMIIVWAALESMAARLACERASSGEIGELRTIAAGYTSEGAKARIHEYSEANIHFHRKMMQLSKCRRLESTGEELFRHLRPVRRHAMQDTSRTEQSVVDHTNIIEAVSRRDAGLAGDLVRDHTLRLGDYIRRSWSHLRNDTKDPRGTHAS